MSGSASATEGVSTINRELQALFQSKDTFDLSISPISVLIKVVHITDPHCHEKYGKTQDLQEHHLVQGCLFTITSFLLLPFFIFSPSLTLFHSLSNCLLSSTSEEGSDPEQSVSSLTQMITSSARNPSW